MWHWYNSQREYFLTLFYVASGHGGFTGADDIEIETALFILQKRNEERENEDIFKMQLAGVDQKVIERMRRKQIERREYRPVRFSEAEKAEVKGMFDSIFQDMRK